MAKNAAERIDRYTKCMDALDTAKYEAAQAEDMDLAEEIQELVGKAYTKKDELSETIEGGTEEQWQSPF